VGEWGGGLFANSPRTSGQFSYQNFFMKCPTVGIVLYIRPVSLDSHMLQRNIQMCK